MIVVLATACVMSGQSPARPKWVGSWILDAEKSTLGPFLAPVAPEGLRVIGQTIKIEQTAKEIKIVGDTVMSNRSSYHDDTSLSLDGAETVVAPGFTLSFRRIDDSAFDIIGKATARNSTIATVSHFVFSSDGRTLTETKNQSKREVVPDGDTRATGAVIGTSSSVLVFNKGF